MHLPDHVLDPVTSLGAGLLSAAALGYAAATAQHSTRIPSFGTVAATAATVFAAQMLNFPISDGVSGHVLGGAVAAIVLGPRIAMLAMAVVVVVQCVLFQDGGATALGANLLNMAVVAPIVGFSAFETLRQRWQGFAGTIASAGIAAWLSVQAAAVTCTIAIARGGEHGFLAASGAMLASHSLIGCGEALATGLAAATLLAMGRMAMPDDAESNELSTGIAFPALAGLAAALILAIVLAPWASPLPDGLEAALSNLGWSENAAPILPAPFADYEIAALADWGLAASMAGAVGTVVVFAAASLLAVTLPTPRRGT